MALWKFSRGFSFTQAARSGPAVKKSGFVYNVLHLMYVGQYIIGGQEIKIDDMSNVTDPILSKVGQGLLHSPNHPLKIIKVQHVDCSHMQDTINKFFEDEYRLKARPHFKLLDSVSPGRY